MEPHKNKLNLRSFREFSLNWTNPDNKTNALDLLELDTKRLGDLKSAFANMTTDVMEQFQKAITVLENPHSTVLKILNAINGIRDYIDGIESVNNFIKVGGAKILKLHLESKNPQICLNVMYLISEMAQNNPFCQEYFLKLNIMPKLSEHLKSDTDDIGAAAIHTITSLIMNYAPGLLAFQRIDGIQTLLSNINKSHTRKMIKASLLIAKLSMQSENVRDEFVAKYAIENLSQFIHVVHGYDVKNENLLFAISVLTKSPKWKSNDKLKCDLNRQLNQFLDINKNLPQSEDMIEYAMQILKNLGGGNAN